MPTVERLDHPDPLAPTPPGPSEGLFGPTDAIPGKAVSRARHAAERLERIASMIRHEIAAAEAGGPAWKFEYALANAWVNLGPLRATLKDAHRAAGPKRRRERP